MKSVILLIFACWFTTAVTHAQKWGELTDEQKLMKLKSFRADNQKFLKDSLKLTPTQMSDIDNVNICFLSTLDRINRYVKDDAKKEEYAEAVGKTRWAQLDGIMGVDKHNRYAEYVKRKLEKVGK